MWDVGLRRGATSDTPGESRMGVTIEHAVLSGLRRYEDVDAGISEEFLPDACPLTGAEAIVARPLEDAATTAWVICPSLGKERAYLRRLESLAARSLAAAGFPALRIRGVVEPAFAETRELDLG